MEVQIDEKIETVLAMLEEGYTQDEIVQHYGNKNWKSIDMYFRRRGYRWKDGTFIPFDEKKEQERKEVLASVQSELTKAAKIIRSLGKEYADIMEVATKNGFESTEELGQYMMSKGYKWNQEIENYVEFTQEEEEELPTEEHTLPTFNLERNQQVDALLTYLLQNEEQLKDLLDTTNRQLPTFQLRGGNANKTLTMNTKLIALLVDYSSEYNVTQKSIIETALVEFFEKYNYKEEVNKLFLN